MTEYANSEPTKMALIMAAGKLFAEHGIDAVTTRAIARKAQESLGVIHYHFGNKDGLLVAVMDYASEYWRDDPLGSFLNRNRLLLQTPDGQEKLIVQMIKIYLSIIFSPNRPTWSRTLIFQLIQRDLPISQKIFDRVAYPCIQAFMEIYHAVAVDRDEEKAYHWSIAIFSSAVVSAVNPLAFQRMNPSRRPSDQFMDKLENSCIDYAVASLRQLRADHGR